MSTGSDRGPLIRDLKLKMSLFVHFWLRLELKESSANLCLFVHLYVAFAFFALFVCLELLVFIFLQIT